MAKLTLETTFPQAVALLCEGNPGAMSALMQMCDADCDRDSAFASLTPFLNLDSFEIYGSDIYILFNDICDRDAVLSCAVLRAVQLGLFDRETLKDACARQDRSGKAIVNAPELLAKVKERLPNFGANADEKNIVEKSALFAE